MTDAVFWAAVQGIGTVLAAIAAIIALVIAGRQLSQVIASNKLLAASNEAMTESNIALTRPYVVVDFEFTPTVTRGGSTFGVSVFVTVRNDGKTPAHNVAMSVDRPFEPISTPNTDGWREAIADLNRMTDGSTVLRSLTNTRPLKYYLDGEELFGKGNEPAPSWRVEARYEDSDGREYHEFFSLEVEPWRRSIAIADPLVRIGKYVDAVAHAVKALDGTVKSKKLEVRVDARNGGGRQLL